MHLRFTGFALAAFLGVSLLAGPVAAKSLVGHTATKSAHVVKIVGSNFTFSPKTITIKKGQTVTWVNKTTVAHTATQLKGKWNTGTINPGKKASHKFTKVGLFKYHCIFHAFMHGKVKVVK